MRAPLRSARRSWTGYVWRRHGDPRGRYLIAPLVGSASLGVLWLIGWWDTPRRIAATIIGVLLALLAAALVAWADER